MARPTAPAICFGSLASFRQQPPGFAEALESRAAEPEVGLGEKAVHADERAAAGDDLLLGLSQLIGPHALLMLEHVINVAAVHALEHPAREEIVAQLIAIPA